MTGVGLGGAPTEEGGLGSIGGTSFAKLAGLVKNPEYGNPHSVWLKVMGMAEPWDPGAAAQRGTRLEPVVAQLAEDAVCGLDKNGRYLRHPLVVTERWPEPYSNFSASIDRLMWEGKDLVGPVELKTMNTRASWEGQGPASYICQLQSYIWFCHLRALEEGKGGCNEGWLVCLRAHEDVFSIIRNKADAARFIEEGSAELIVEKFERDPAFMDSIVPIAQRFWDEHVETREPPRADGTKACAEALRKHYGIVGEEIQADGELEKLAEEQRHLREAVAALTARRLLVENQIKERMAGASVARGAALTISIDRVKGARRFDRASFSKEHPDLDEAFTKVGKDSDRLKIKMNGDP